MLLPSTRGSLSLDQPPKNPSFSLSLTHGPPLDPPGFLFGSCLSFKQDQRFTEFSPLFLLTATKSPDNLGHVRGNSKTGVPPPSKSFSPLLFTSPPPEFQDQNVIVMPWVPRINEERTSSPIQRIFLSAKLRLPGWEKLFTILVEFFFPRLLAPPVFGFSVGHPCPLRFMLRRTLRERLLVLTPITRNEKIGLLLSRKYF